MALYSFRYTNLDGEDKEVERRFPMGECPEAIMVEENGVNYEATRIFGAVGRHSSWDAYEPSDLPPVNAPMLK